MDLMRNEEQMKHSILHSIIDAS